MLVFFLAVFLGLLSFVFSPSELDSQTLAAAPTLSPPPTLVTLVIDRRALADSLSANRSTHTPRLSSLFVLRKVRVSSLYFSSIPLYLVSVVSNHLLSSPLFLLRSLSWLSRLSRSKTEYLYCKFSASEGEVASEVAIEGAAVPRGERFRYLGSIIQANGEIDEDINQRIKVGWQKWRNASGVLCDMRIPLRLKGKVYRMIVRPALLYGAECWPVKSGAFKG